MIQNLYKIGITGLFLLLTLYSICQEVDDLYAKPGEKISNKKSKSAEITEPVCDIKTDKVDEFTKTRIIEIQPKYIGHSEIGSRLTAGITIFEDQLLLRIELYSSSTMCFNDNCKTLLKLANDSIIALSYMGDTECAGLLMGYFIINESAINPLTSNDIVKIRVYTTEGYIDYQINDKWPIVNRTSPAVNPQQYLKFSLQCAIDQAHKDPISKDDF
jgi:hypothetical protein